MICRLEEEDRGRQGSVKVWDGAQIMQATRNLTAPLNVSATQHMHIFSKCFLNNIRLESVLCYVLCNIIVEKLYCRMTTITEAEVSLQTLCHR